MHLPPQSEPVRDTSHHKQRAYIELLKSENVRLHHEVEQKDKAIAQILEIADDYREQLEKFRNASGCNCQ